MKPGTSAISDRTAGNAERLKLTTLQTSRNAADRPVAPSNGAFDAGLRPRPFPGETASLLPGLLAATRTGLPSASDDELTNEDPPWH
jgi:hypothetical protein